jgi:predicted anti-sigma-YlaC factor YlaD
MDELTCAGTRDLLVARAVEPRLALDELAVQRHLAWCAACRQQQRTLRALAGTLDVRGAVDLAPEPRVYRALRQELARQSPRLAAARAWRGRTAWLAAAAAALAVVLGASPLAPARQAGWGPLAHGQRAVSTVADSYAVLTPSRLPEAQVPLQSHLADSLLLGPRSATMQPADSI